MEGLVPSSVLRTFQVVAKNESRTEGTGGAGFHKGRGLLCSSLSPHPHGHCRGVRLFSGLLFVHNVRLSLGAVCGFHLGLCEGWRVCLQSWAKLLAV